MTSFRISAMCPSCIHPQAHHQFGWCETCGCRFESSAPTRHTARTKRRGLPPLRGWVRNLSTRPRPSSTRSQANEHRGRVDHFRWAVGTLAGIFLLAVGVSVANGQGFGVVEFLLTLAAGTYLLWAVGLAK